MSVAFWALWDAAQTQRLIIRFKALNLALREEIEDSAGSGVLVVRDVAGNVLDGVPGIARLRRHVIANLCDSLPILAAAVLVLHLHGVELLHERRLLIASGKLRRRESARHGPASHRQSR